MLNIKCPYCGDRSQKEFAYGGDGTITRPKLNQEISDEEWDNFVYLRKSPRGKHIELWHHIAGCRQWFNLARNTATDEILAVYKMGEAPPKLKANIPATPSGEPSIGSGNLSTSKKDRF